MVRGGAHQLGCRALILAQAQVHSVLVRLVRDLRPSCSILTMDDCFNTTTNGVPKASHRSL